MSSRPDTAGPAAASPNRLRNLSEVVKFTALAALLAIGTMLFGIGIGRGAIITGVHVLLLTIYYWTLSPIGLPSQPEWLDLERTWITGLPA